MLYSESNTILKVDQYAFYGQQGFLSHTNYLIRQLFT